MNVETKTFENLFIGNTTQYKVPFFQRGYVWDKRQWTKLLESIRKEVFQENISVENETQRRDYFFGTIVLKSVENTSMNEFIIIDGQQRILTCYVCLILLHKEMVRIENRSQISNTTSNEMSNYLKNIKNDKNHFNELKVVSTQGDTLPIYRLLNENQNPTLPNNDLGREQELYRRNNNIERLERFFQKRIANKYNTLPKIKMLMEAILKSLQCVCIYLPENFDEQIIFETLNAEGVELTSSELLCNYIFGKVGKNEIEKKQLHYEKWLLPQRALERTQGDNKKEEYAKFEAYLRYLFSIGSEKMLPKGRPVYYTFKRKYNDSSLVLEQLNNICTKIKFFQAYIKPHEVKDSCGQNICYFLADFVNIGIHSIVPFIIELLNWLEQEKYNQKPKEETESILKIITTLLVRQRVSRSNPQYDVFFPNLFSKIEQKSDNKIEALKTIIQDKKLNIADDKFKEALISNPIYLERDKKFPYYILSQINKKLEEQNYNQSIKTGTFSQIEHILPQNENLPQEWKTHLKDDIKDLEFSTLKHTLGNLTIIGDGNQALGDLFIEKKINHKAYGDPRPPITKSIIDIYNKEKKWNLATIKERSSFLADIACERWSLDIDKKN